VTIELPATEAVLLPGTGSDERFVRSVFQAPLDALGVTLHAPAPPRFAPARGYLRELDAAARASRGPILVGGISFGAHLAAEWAVRNPRTCAGLLLAMPAWIGEPEEAPAAVAARWSADLVEREGLDAALAGSAAGVPPWLATELDRAWRRHGTALPGGLRAAAERAAPTHDELRTLAVPTGIATCSDDPIHPAAVARRWVSAVPRAAFVGTTLEAMGADRQALGRAAVLAWLRALGDPVGDSSGDGRAAVRSR